MQSTQSLLAYLDVVFELWFQTVIQHGWDPERVAVWSDFQWQSSESPLATISASGESEKSKCQIETLIGLTSPHRGTGPLPATRPTNATRNQNRQQQNYLV